MIHNAISNDVRILSTGYAEESISLPDGEEMLPGGYYMELDIDGEEFVVAIDQRVYHALHNAIASLPDKSGEDPAFLTNVVVEAV